MSKYYDFELSSVLPRLTRDVLTIVDDYFAGDVSHCQNCAEVPLLVNGFKPEQFKVVRIYCELKENDGTPTVDRFEDAYHGFADSHSEFAKERVESCESDYQNSVPDWMKDCFDWNKVWGKLSVDYAEEEGHYFFRPFLQVAHHLTQPLKQPLTQQD